MADPKADTLVLPKREEAPKALDPVFKDLWEEKRGPVKSLHEAGLTKIVIAWQDRRGVLRSKTALVSQDTCEAVVSLVNEEQLG